MDIFNQVNNQIKKTTEQWKEIDRLADKIKTQCDALPDNDLMKDALSLILLLTEQMRPVGNLGEQATKLQEDITQMLSMFSGGKK